MGARDPDQVQAGGVVETRDATVPESPAVADTPVIAPAPLYRLGSADAHPQPVSRLRTVLTAGFLVVLLGSAATFEIVQWRNQRALRTATAAANREAELVAEQLTREQQAAVEREAARQQQVQAQDDARRRELAERQRAEQAAVDQSRAREQAREAAWAAYYRPAPGCKDSTSVQCANAYIKARREFDRQYASSADAPSPAPGR